MPVKIEQDWEADIAGFARLAICSNKAPPARGLLAPPNTKTAISYMYKKIEQTQYNHVTRNNYPSYKLHQLSKWIASWEQHMVDGVCAAASFPHRSLFDFTLPFP